ncbi:GntR family transcriptional regulator [Cellulomonas composti]|uniref:Transcriptional regulator n=1 Tax=Cellulomonas composti TaxID=266130 RepID=A0A511JD39_9CELL|nr:GntR family transcriptional regulator [Cellulomonas composti]GEL95917.1 transcriptional regulator [Cellulomonas composti]
MTEVLERGSAVPLYVQLEAILHAKIVGGEWLPNQRIPSENELNRLYGLSRMTVRGVLTKLVNDGLLLRVPGKGTYVAPHKIDAVSPAYGGVREQLEGLGYSTTTQLVSCALEAPSSGVRAELRLGDGDEAWTIVRVRSVQDEPISLHRSHVPAALAPDLDRHDVVTGQLCVVLEESYGLPMRRVREHLEAHAVTTTEAKHLGMHRGEPALLLHDVISDGQGRPFEYSSIVFRGDKLRLRFDYER